MMKTLRVATIVAQFLHHREQIIFFTCIALKDLLDLYPVRFLHRHVHDRYYQHASSNMASLQWRVLQQMIEALAYSVGKVMGKRRDERDVVLPDPINPLWLLCCPYRPQANTDMLQHVREAFIYII